MTDTIASEAVYSFERIRNMVMGALMAALMAVGAFIIVPVGPVPIVLQNLFVMLAGLILGPWWGMASVAIYLMAGLVGLPVFSGGGAGLAHLLGPTGGYLMGYLPAVFLVGLLSRLGNKMWTRHDGRSAALVAGLDILAMAVAAATVYACGVPWLKIVAGMSWDKALTYGMLPFIAGDAIKIIAAVPMAAGARRMLARYTTES